jgi:hypothetical protein
MELCSLSARPNEILLNSFEILAKLNQKTVWEKTDGLGSA